MQHGNITLRWDGDVFTGKTPTDVINAIIAAPWNGGSRKKLLTQLAQFFGTPIEAIETFSDEQLLEKIQGVVELGKGPSKS